MTGFRLYKYEKLCSHTALNSLFSDGNSAIAYPLRAVFRAIPGDGTPARFLITIPKKKIRHAVDRVLLRRRTREAYRLNRDIIVPLLQEKGITLEVAFIYLDKDALDYSIIETKMRTLLAKIASAIAETPQAEKEGQP